MILCKDLTLNLSSLLNLGQFKDYAPNGLQVEGKAEIQRICTAVTASDEVINKAIALRADALIVHHGYFWKGEDLVITGMKKKRISTLLANNINLLAYHLPLDCHPDFGNNACIGNLLNIHSIQTHTVATVPGLMWSGTLPQSLNGDELNKLLTASFARAPLHIAGHDRRITRIAWCSGGAQGYLTEASELGVDAYISGEVSERTYHEAKELGIDYYSCGHHATERLGIQALGNKLAQLHDLEHVFIDSENPV